MGETHLTHDIPPDVPDELREEYARRLEEHLCCYVHGPMLRQPLFTCNQDAENGSHFCVAHLEAGRTPEQVEKLRALFKTRMSVSSDFYDFRGWRFPEGFKFPKEFKLDADFSCANFAGWPDFTDAHFDGKADFRQAHFDGEANFRKAHFKGSALFGIAHFERAANFIGADFKGKAFFTNAHFKGRAYFKGTYFKGKANFDWVHFEEEAHFSMAHFKGEAYFWKTHFEGEAHFSMAHFEGLANCHGAHFEGEAHFSDAYFYEITDFSEAHFEKWANFGKAHFEKDGDVHFVRTHFEEDANFRKAEFKNEPVFDWSKIMQNIDFLGATFEKGASFSYVAPPPAGAFDRDIKVPPGKGESLYRLAKQIYTKMGLYREAGDFHYMERCHAWHHKAFLDEKGWRRLPRLANPLTWIEYVFGRLIFGYGERPSHVMATSLLAIAVCAWAYNYSEAIIHESGSRLCGFWNALYFSVVTFTTLGFGDYAPIVDSMIGRVAAIEALTGAFLMAAFLVTLARRWGRG